MSLTISVVLICFFILWSVNQCVIRVFFATSFYTTILLLPCASCSTDICEYGTKNVKKMVLNMDDMIHIDDNTSNK